MIIQTQFLNRVIQSGDMSIITVNNIDASFFPDYQKEFKYIVDHYNEYGNVPDQSTFVSQFRDFDIIQVDETDRYLLDELFKDKQTRQMAIAFNKVKDLLRDHKVDEAVSVFNDTYEKIGQAKHIETVDIIHDISRYDDYLAKATDFNQFYLKTGFPELDSILGGWDKNEELTTIVARPNVGKSYVLLKTALAAAQQGLTVGLYSGEMSEKKMGFRADTLFGNISNTKVKHGDRSVQNEYKQLLEKLVEVKGKLLILTPKMLGSLATVSAFRAFIEKEKLDMLCVDQHSLMEDERHARDATQKAANISWDLKQLQVLEGIPIITVSQANREIPEDGTITLENIAQTDRIGQDSTVVIGLTQKDNVLSLHILKNRDGEKGGVLRYAADFDKGIFSFVPNEKDGVEDTDYKEVKDRYDVGYDDGGDEF